MEFDLQKDLSVLIGPNGSGKTNILTALMLLNKLLDFDERYRRMDERQVSQCELTATFKIGSKSLELHAILGTYTDDNNNDEIRTARQYWNAKDFTGRDERVPIPLSGMPWMGVDRIETFVAHTDKYVSKFIRDQGYYYSKQFKKPAINAFRRVAEFASNMKYYSATQFTNPGNCPVAIQIEQEGARRIPSSRKGHSKFIFDLFEAYKAARKGSAYSQYLGFIGPSGIGLIDEIKFEELVTSSVDHQVRIGGRSRTVKRNKRLVIPTFRLGKQVLSPNQLSEGTFKTITLLFYLITEQSSILLVEEPEVCVHHGLLTSIIDLIRIYSKQKQIVMSTHSDYVLDEIDLSSVYTVSSTPASGTRIRHVSRNISEKELSAIKEYLKTSGNLGELWRAGGLE